MTSVTKRNLKRPLIYMMILCISTIVIVLLNGAFSSQAYTEKTGTVTGNYVRVRKEAVTGSEICKLNSGHAVTITNEKVASDKYTWYYIKFKYNNKNTAGWIRSDFIKVNVVSNPEKRSGVVNGTGVNVRQSAPSGTSICKLNVGHAVTVTNEKTVSGAKWYYIKFTLSGKAKAGWMYGSYVTLKLDPVDPSKYPDFEAYLSKQGFPESYRTYLRALHNKYPNWVFVAQQTGLNWDTVIKEESILGINLVPSSSPSSWKSTEAGAYNWSTDTWVGRDTASWVAASKSVVEYFMDPRNFLNDNPTMLQFEALDFATTHNTTGISNILAGSFMATSNYYKIFYDAGKNALVSPYHLASRALQEVGRNGSHSSSGKYPGYVGYYNFFNIGSSPNADGKGAVVNGLKNAKAKGWTTPARSIKGGATFIGEKYIYKGQSTLYYQKFNVVYNGGYGLYRHQYMTNIQAPTSEAKNMMAAYKDLNSSSVTFYIPVYKNMPSKVAPMPTKTGSPNNKLASLWVTNYKVTPSFNMNTQKYSLIVPSNVASIKVNATAIRKDVAKVSGTGTKSLKPGENTITIKCTAQDGSARNYKLTVMREIPGVVDPTPTDTPETTPNPIGTITTKYKVGSYISGVKLGGTIKEVASNITVKNATVKIVDSKGKTKSSVIATGDKIQIYAGSTKKKEYPVVVYGDITGDGTINGLDALYIKRHILNIKKLTGVYAEAANTNKSSDKVLNGLDALYIKRHILNIKKITQ